MRPHVSVTNGGCVYLDVFDVDFAKIRCGLGDGSLLSIVVFKSRVLVRANFPDGAKWQITLQERHVLDLFGRRWDVFMLGECHCPRFNLRCCACRLAEAWLS